MAQRGQGAGIRCRARRASSLEWSCSHTSTEGSADFEFSSSDPYEVLQMSVILKWARLPIISNGFLVVQSQNSLKLNRNLVILICTILSGSHLKAYHLLIIEPNPIVHRNLGHHHSVNVYGGQNRNSKQKRLTPDERDMTLRPKVRATSSQTNNEKDKRDRTKLPDAHLHLVKNDYLAEIIPGVIFLNNGSQQNKCLVQQV